MPLPTSSDNSLDENNTVRSKIKKIEMAIINIPTSVGSM
jgi:hypothetical protein